MDNGKPALTRTHTVKELNLVKRLATDLFLSLTRFWKTQDQYEPGVIAELAAKYEGEREEQNEAWFEYEDHVRWDKDSHRLNGLWLNLIDESSDLLNTVVCFAWQNSDISLADREIVGLFDDFDVLLPKSTDFERYVKDLRYALEAAAIAKGKVTPLRIHKLME